MILKEAIDICCDMADNICIKKINGDNEFEMPMEEWQDALFESDEPMYEMEVAKIAHLPSSNLCEIYLNI
jgi:hypothetical protein